MLCKGSIFGLHVAFTLSLSLSIPLSLSLLDQRVALDVQSVERAFL